MDLNKISFFAMAKKRLAWLTQRQEVLAHNVANADTPKFKARDLKAFRFEQMVRRESMQLNMEVTQAGHAGGRRKRIRDFAEETDRHPFETSPADNAIVLEEQMAKIHETNTSHKLTTKLYAKQLSMIVLAVKSR
ncbi:MAG: flagellar basal body rod protein FlgB [Rhodospirillales bacterium]|nr:flagellar basal body rod protein FlgB [Rhodospirillales bacterium]